MTEQHWQDWFDERPCADGWARFCAAFANGLENWFDTHPCADGWLDFRAAFANGLDAALAAATEDERAWGAEHSLRPELFILLAQDAHFYVRGRVARNPHTPGEILTVLAQDADDGVRGDAAANPHTPPASLLKLAQDADIYVRRNAADNPSTPPIREGEPHE